MSDLTDRGLTIGALVEENKRLESEVARLRETLQGRVDSTYVTFQQRIATLESEVARLTGALQVALDGVASEHALARQLTEALKQTRDALPDSANTGYECYDWCWEDLAGDAQEWVQVRRAEANAALAAAKARGL